MTNVSKIRDELDSLFAITRGAIIAMQSVEQAAKTNASASQIVTLASDGICLLETAQRHNSAAARLLDDNSAPLQAFTAWMQASTAHREAERAMRAYEGGDMKRANDAHRQATSDEARAYAAQAVQEAEQALAQLVDAHGEAIDALMLTPAPDMGALAEKLALFAVHQLYAGWHRAGDIAEQLRADAETLAKGGC